MINCFYICYYNYIILYNNINWLELIGVNGSCNVGWLMKACIPRTMVIYKLQ